ncbi:MAG: L-glutamate gamma-semialdehyde dehydrogenase [Planctomycetia bacterium]|mgnify:FL=1|nr:L-glutamate gamma-semialdehyde dehydrogenase [Planctomycetia bacterium]MBL6915949.1 L-glutamate gamma-semialdehyde dehydrogenase [Planctomycetota bacterium]MDG2083896.1 L-glutamate gamma-semialdehyde dehydrogenase [Planctomycetota bacterium]HCW44504.1 1-pyrroline-5-carboxylate dehydrogenase [Planctomycetota bacterium]
MENYTFNPGIPENEPILNYAPGSAERVSLEARLASMASETPEIPCIVGGQPIFTGEIREQRCPHDHSLVLARWHCATPEVVQKAVDSAESAWVEWSNTSQQVRAAVMERAANLLQSSWRDEINASTMLGQSKTVLQSEIDAACELIDFFKFNNYYALQQIPKEQPPINPPGVWNHVDHRPLEGFVYAVTPFNFTSIAANLCTAPVLMGNTVVWKPSEHSVLSNWVAYKLLEEAGLPPGVINFVPGDPVGITQEVLSRPSFAGIHYTGSTTIFRQLWQQIGNQLESYKNYPRIVGETGGKDFIFAHPSASVAELSTAAIRGAFEYQGQKCSAASRLYVPKSLWPELKESLVETTRSLDMGDVSDFKNFMGAVIHEGAFQRNQSAIERARDHQDSEIICGGECDSSQGWFVSPTIIECQDPKAETMETELFGPVLSVHVYKDEQMEEALDLVDTTSPYALTGAVFSSDRVAADKISARLRYSAGNFYINDKPTGAVVGQQPFGGARASGTDDKAGSALNLLRWIAPRTVKENLMPPKDHTYPHMS